MGSLEITPTLGVMQLPGTFNHFVHPSELLAVLWRSRSVLVPFTPSEGT